MTRKEARRLALLTVLTEIQISLDVSDEWCRHPETDAEFTRREALQVRTEAQRFVDALERRVGKLDDKESTRGD